MTDDPTRRWATRIRAGERGALARAITLIESLRPEDRAHAEALLDALAPHDAASWRIGVTGPPGVGKSTFIDSLGAALIAAGHRVAVLAVDPSSARSGGSVLGDKTRMQRLAGESAAYVRPTPTGGVLGGVARRSRDTILLCEAAGYDVVLVETVGVGQSEIAVGDIVDVVVVLAMADSGDELQGIKRGLLEVGDVVVVNKADGDRIAASEATRAMLEGALAMARATGDGGWQPRVLTCSSLEDASIVRVVAALLEHRDAVTASGAWAERRIRQRLAALDDAVRTALADLMVCDPEVVQARSDVLPDVSAGRVTAGRGAQAVLAALRGRAPLARPISE